MTPIGTRSADDLFGNDGEDAIRGRAGNDRLFGGAGDDVIRGGRGADILQGGSGDDVLFGGKGRDIFVVQDFDQIADFQSGRDKVVLIGGADSGAAHIGDDVFLVEADEPMTLMVSFPKDTLFVLDDLLIA